MKNFDIARKCTTIAGIPGNNCPISSTNKTVSVSFKQLTKLNVQLKINLLITEMQRFLLIKLLNPAYRTRSPEKRLL